jgi:hypothetical protein
MYIYKYVLDSKMSSFNLFFILINKYSFESNLIHFLSGTMCTRIV